MQRILKTKLRSQVCALAALVCVLVPSECPQAHGAPLSEAYFGAGVIPHLRIYLQERELTALRLQPRSYVMARVLEADSIFHDVGTHLKGQYGTFQGTDGKPSLTLNFDKFVRGQKFHGLDKLHLNNSVSDRTYMTELLGRELFRAANLPASRATQARVEINGRDAGFYVLVEGYDKTFLRQYFTNISGNLYDSEFRHDITDPLKKSSGKGCDDHSDLKRLAAAAEEPDPPQRLRQLASLIDLDRFYSFLALELVTCHFDGYARSVNNYRLYHDPTTGKMVFMPTGMDQMFYNPEGSLHPELTGIVAKAVLGTSEGRREYRQRCVILFTNLFPKLSGQVEEVRQRIRPVLAAYGTDAVAHHDQAVTNLQQRIARRIEHLRKHLLAPPAPLLTLQPNCELMLTNWLWSVEEGKAKMTTTALALRMQLLPGEKPAIATWEHRLLLPKGHYQISAAVNANEPVFRGPDSHISIKVWGGSDTGFESTRQDRHNIALARNFLITSDDPEDVVIQCQASSAEAHVTFDFTSLTLRRLE